MRRLLKIKRCRIKTFHVVLLLFIPILACVSVLNGEETYTWTDEKGIIHITDKPPPQNVKLKDTIKYKESPYQDEYNNKTLQKIVDSAREDGTLLKKSIEKMKETKKRLEEEIEIDKRAVVFAKGDLSRAKTRAGKWAKSNIRVAEGNLRIARSNLIQDEIALKNLKEKLIEDKQRLENAEKSLKEAERNLRQYEMSK